MPPATADQVPIGIVKVARIKPVVLQAPTALVTQRGPACQTRRVAVASHRLCGGQRIDQRGLVYYSYIISNLCYCNKIYYLSRALGRADALKLLVGTKHIKRSKVG